MALEQMIQQRLTEGFPPAEFVRINSKGEIR
jgi:hypothetical protein